jgi:hypothetical protein
VKKIVALFLLTVLGSSLFAAFQYEVVVVENTGPLGYPVVSGEAYYIRITEGSGSIYITDKINNLNSMSGNGEVLSNRLLDVSDTSTYGWVDNKTGELHNADGSTIVVNQHQENQWNDLVIQTGYKLGDFQEGDEIGVWLTAKTWSGSTDVTGASIMDRTAPVNADHMNYRDYGKEQKDKFGTTIAQLQINGAVATIFFGFHGVESIDGGAFDGQPLPGMLATFLLGGGALGAAGLRRKRKES